MLFYAHDADAAQYVVPAQSGVSALYAGDFWLAGKVGDEVRSAAAYYSQFAFRPGLTGTDRTAPPPAECAAADRIWTVARADVAAYEATGTATADLAEWPVGLGAPVRDGDGVPGNYSLASGDRPLLRGDVTAFWAMTDAAASPRQIDGPPLGVDVTVEAFAFLTGPEALTSGTFYRYAVINRSAVVLDSLHAGLWADVDLGNPSDDYVGTDTTLAMVYVYNGDKDDESVGSIPGYGPAPPAVGVLMLDSPAGPDRRALGLTASHTFFNTLGPDGIPDTPAHIFYRMQGRFNDGSPMREGGDGYSGAGVLTTFAYPGDSVTDQFWSMQNTDAAGGNRPSADQRALLASGPFTLPTDSTAVFVYGIVYGRGSSHLNSVTVLRQHAAEAQAAYDSGLLGTAGEAPPSGTPAFTLRPASPNPFIGSTALQLGGEAATVVVVDVLGRVVERHAVPAGTASVRVGAALAPGVYGVVVTAPGGRAAQTVVKAE